MPIRHTLTGRRVLGLGDMGNTAVVISPRIRCSLNALPALPLP
ncbi:MULTISPECIES: hypothetical protein [Aeromicrobium]|nr:MULTISPECIES: hypothetical protein [Aeromicrobium]